MLKVVTSASAVFLASKVDALKVESEYAADVGAANSYNIAATTAQSDQVNIAQSHS